MILPKRTLSKIIIKKEKKKEVKSTREPDNQPNNELLRFQKKVKNLKTLKFSDLAHVIKEVLIDSGINENDFVAKLQKMVPT